MAFKSLRSTFTGGGGMKISIPRHSLQSGKGLTKSAVSLVSCLAGFHLKMNRNTIGIGSKMVTEQLMSAMNNLRAPGANFTTEFLGPFMGACNRTWEHIFREQPKSPAPNLEFANLVASLGRCINHSNLRSGDFGHDAHSADIH